MLENSFYSVISPEGCATILFERRRPRAPGRRGAADHRARPAAPAGHGRGRARARGRGPHRSGGGRRRPARPRIVDCLAELLRSDRRRSSPRPRYRRFRAFGTPGPSRSSPPRSERRMSKDARRARSRRSVRRGELLGKVGGARAAQLGPVPATRPTSRSSGDPQAALEPAAASGGGMPHGRGHAQRRRRRSWPGPDDGGGGHVIEAPMVGTFYRAPEPGAPPFVAVGDLVEAGQAVGIVEAMKLMNEIESEAGWTRRQDPGRERPDGRVRPAAHPARAADAG